MKGMGESAAGEIRAEAGEDKKKVLLKRVWMGLSPTGACS